MEIKFSIYLNRRIFIMATIPAIGDNLHEIIRKIRKDMMMLKLIQNNGEISDSYTITDRFCHSKFCLTDVGKNM